jgi:RHS repeat-associated protein
VAEYSTQQSATPQVSYLTQDHLGSPRIITDNTGKIIARKDFNAFGDETSSAQRTELLGYKPEEVRQDYTGYQKDDESGLEFAQARYYNTKHGRFTSVDPLTASANVKDPQTFNRYSYAMNSPYKFTDPLGLAARPRQSSLVDAGAIASDARTAPARGTDPIVTGGRANSTPSSAQAAEPPPANGVVTPSSVTPTAIVTNVANGSFDGKKGVYVLTTGMINSLTGTAQTVEQNKVAYDQNAETALAASKSFVDAVDAANTEPIADVQDLFVDRDHGSIASDGSVVIPSSVTAGTTAVQVTGQMAPGGVGGNASVNTVSGTSTYANTATASANAANDQNREIRRINGDNSAERSAFIKQFSNTIVTFHPNNTGQRDIKVTLNNRSLNILFNNAVQTGLNAAQKPR